MRFSRFAGVSIVPVLARIVLAMMFIPIGYHKVFDTETFHGPAAQILTDLGIGTPVEEAAFGATSSTMHLVSFRQDDAAEEPAEDTPATDTPETKPTSTPPAESKPGIPASDLESAPDVPAETTTGDPAPVTARAVHGVTAMLVDGGWPTEWKPQYMAWLAGLTELVGGTCILLGLFGRIWGLGLAVAMGFAFYLTSRHTILDPGLFNIANGDDGYAAFNRLGSQAGLFVLGLGVFFTGPGPLSLDRLLFRRKKKGANVGKPPRSNPAPVVTHAPAPPPPPIPRPAPVSPGPAPTPDMDDDDRPGSTVRPL